MGKSRFKLSARIAGRHYEDAARGMGDLGKHFDDLGKKLPRLIEGEIRNILLLVQAELAARHGSPWSPGQRNPTGDRTGRLSVRSGALQRHLAKPAVVKIKGQEIIVGQIVLPGKVGIHEDGGKIQARSKKFLAIPLPAALTSRGQRKLRDTRAHGNTFVIKSKRGNLLVVMKKGDQLIPLYLLKKSVTIPARLGVQATMNSRIAGFTDSTINRIIRDAAEFRRG